MVKRCAFYVKDGVVKRCVVEINWELGFTSYAKLEYINRLYYALHEKGLSNILDVTSANKGTQCGYILSPMYIKKDGISVEDLYMQQRVRLDGQASRMLFYDWLYGKMLSEKHINMIKCYDVFVDVFHKPDVSKCTQAKSCAIFKLLLERGMLDLYDDAVRFYDWRLKNVDFVT